MRTQEAHERRITLTKNRKCKPAQTDIIVFLSVMERGEWEKEKRKWRINENRTQEAH